MDGGPCVAPSFARIGGGVEFRGFQALRFLIGVAGGFVERRLVPRVGHEPFHARLLVRVVAGFGGLGLLGEGALGVGAVVRLHLGEAAVALLRAGGIVGGGGGGLGAVGGDDFLKFGAELAEGGGAGEVLFQFGGFAQGGDQRSGLGEAADRGGEHAGVDFHGVGLAGFGGDDFAVHLHSAGLDRGLLAFELGRHFLHLIRVGAGRVALEETVEFGDPGLIGGGVEQVGRGREGGEFREGFLVGLLADDLGDVRFRDALLVLDAFGDLNLDHVLLAIFLQHPALVDSAVFQADRIGVGGSEQGQSGEDGQGGAGLHGFWS